MAKTNAAKTLKVWVKRLSLDMHPPEKLLIPQVVLPCLSIIATRGIISMVKCHDFVTCRKIPYLPFELH